MRVKNISIGVGVVLRTPAAAMLTTGTRAAAQTEKVLYNFGEGEEYDSPFGSLILDAKGNLYGITIGGGAYLYGTVFKLTPTAEGTWTRTVLHNFGKGKDGASPQAGLIFDAVGNLYGTTASGGAGSSCGFVGCGTVFELMPGADGVWTEKILHNFGEHSDDGFEPFGSLIFDSAGNVYGTTFGGGSVPKVCSNSSATGCGTVFELTPTAGGDRAERVLHSFGESEDGRNPESSLVFDSAGNLYGTTFVGGSGSSCANATGCGTVFELTPGARAGWTEKVIHNFTNNGRDGYEPVGNLAFDSAGNLYSTTSAGGTGSSCGYLDQCGTVFELTPGTGGGWREKVLHNFTGTGQDGFTPYAGLTLDGVGNLYGTTYSGGTYGNGAVFELSRTAGGTETVLYSFEGGAGDGQYPEANLILDAAGNLYGTTFAGGAYSEGIAFEIRHCDHHLHNRKAAP
jgi:uncharacterized repeat protein (TIGR03803 family)